MLNDVIKKINLISNVFVDLDGTLVDTDMANTLSYHHALDTLSYNEVKLPTNERITRATLESLNIPNQQIQEIVECKNVVYVKFLHLTRVNLFLLNLLQQIRHSHNFYLVSSANQERVHQVLKHHHLLPFFKGIICKKQNKYRHAINILGINTSQIFVFENCEQEIKHAISAGIHQNNIFHIKGGF